MPSCILQQPTLRLTAAALALPPVLQDWDAQQKAQREHILAGWKPDDDEEEDKDSGEHGDWTFAGGVWCVAGQLLLPGHAHMFLAAKLVAPPLLPA